jgi:hypothetical protein
MQTYLLGKHVHAFQALIAELHVSNVQTLTLAIVIPSDQRAETGKAKVERLLGDMRFCVLHV